MRACLTLAPIFTSYRRKTRSKEGGMQDKLWRTQSKQRLQSSLLPNCLHSEDAPLSTVTPHNHQGSSVNVQVPMTTHLISLSTTFHVHVLAPVLANATHESSRRARENAIVMIPPISPALPTVGRRLGFSRAAMVLTQYPASTTERQLPGITTTTMITRAAVNRETAPDRVRLHDSPGARERGERARDQKK